MFLSVRQFSLSFLFVLSLSAFVSFNIQASKADDTKGDIDVLITGAIQGKETGLPLPRFVSLKGNRTNMRVGPSFDHRIAWVYVKKGVPVEVIQEFEIWRKIRDADGQEGWVHKALLSHRRAAIVAPWERSEEVKYFPLYKKPTPKASMAAKLEAGVYSKLEECKKEWCKISGFNYSGWVRGENLWGVYPGESIE